jgi:hypothetical protein
MSAPEKRPSKLIQITITALALGLIVLHLARPNLKIDSITISLLVIAALPWIYSIIESAKFPGGWEIKLRDTNNAGLRIEGAMGFVVSQSLAKSHDQSLPLQDPNLALVGLRIQIERTIRALAAKHNLNPNQQPLTRLVDELSKLQILPADTARGVSMLVRYGNKAAHGASVEPQVAQWANEWGPSIVAALDNLAIGE